MTRAISSKLIAPCGMDCGVCAAHLREKNKCPGCRAEDPSKPKTRLLCKIRNCRERKGGFCFSCAEFPCDKIKHIDRRYRTKYSMSMIENLESIRRIGIRKFVKDERARWACPGCGGLICVHKGYCLYCGAESGRDL